jgi:hypothetical protein
MPVTSKELEDAIRAAIQVIHVKVEDDSGGCGEKYSALIVSKVGAVILSQVLSTHSTLNLTPMTGRWVI